jgi:hypothetical protein
MSGLGALLPMYKWLVGAQLVYMLIEGESRHLVESRIEGDAGDAAQPHVEHIHKLSSSWIVLGLSLVVIHYGSGQHLAALMSGLGALLPMYPVIRMTGSQVYLYLPARPGL